MIIRFKAFNTARSCHSLVVVVVVSVVVPTICVVAFSTVVSVALVAAPERETIVLYTKITLLGMTLAPRRSVRLLPLLSNKLATAGRIHSRHISSIRLAFQSNNGVVALAGNEHRNRHEHDSQHDQHHAPHKRYLRTASPRHLRVFPRTKYRTSISYCEVFQLTPSTRSCRRQALRETCQELR